MEEDESEKDFEESDMEQADSVKQASMQARKIFISFDTMVVFFMDFTSFYDFRYFCLKIGEMAIGTCRQTIHKYSMISLMMHAHGAPEIF